MASKLKSNYQFSTKRLILRFLKKSDYKEWKRSYSSVGKKQNIWDFSDIPLSDEKKLKDHFYKMIEKNNRLKKEDKKYHFGVFEKKTGNLIGYTMLMEVKRDVCMNAQLGYLIHSPYWGKGYGKEAVNATIKLTFEDLKLHRVKVAIEPHNKRSIRLAKSIGLRKEGRCKRMIFLRDEWRDMMIYAMTAEEI